MKKGILWSLMSFTMVLILLLASCGKEATEQTTAATTVKGTTTQQTTTTKTTTTTTTTTATDDTPKYGGTFVGITITDVRNFDDIFPWKCSCHSLILTNEGLMNGDWTKGPAGTGEVSWGLTNGFEAMERYCTNGIAESWEIDPVALTSTFHLRSGIYYQNKAPANGRELVADDVVFCLNRQWTTPGSFVKNSKPAPISITAPDKYTVVVKYDSLYKLTQAIVFLNMGILIFPPEAIEKYGNMSDWHNSVGTGPFMLTDYVKSSSVTLIRNPNYWKTDPIGLGKGNQLPYIDGVKILIITDTSTQMASIRTGKADQIMLNWDMADSLKITNPELQYKTNYYSQSAIQFRMDNPDAPWYKLEVRKALTLAIDFQAIVDSYYGGQADFYSYPTMPGVEYKDMRIPFKELPEDIQHLFSYQPEEAKQLLADAGYAAGFDVEVTCLIKDADLMSIYKDYWAKINVNMIINQKETAVFNNLTQTRAIKDAAFYTTYTSLPFNMNCVTDPAKSSWNIIYLYDQRCIDAHQQIWDEYLDWNKRCQIFKDVTPYILENCWFIQAPSYYQYTMWQPWIKNYHGENSLANCDWPNFVTYIWVDQNLKEEMNGSR